MITSQQLKEELGFSEAELDELQMSASMYEKGEWPAGKVTRVGRPGLAEEPSVSVTFKMPESRAAQISLAAEARGETRSDFLRDAAFELADRVLTGTA